MNKKRALSRASSKGERLIVLGGALYFFILFLFFFLRPGALTWWAGKAPPAPPTAATPAKDQTAAQALLPIKNIRFSLPATPVAGLPGLEDRIFQEINRARKTAGVQELVKEPRLNEIARAHSQDMATRNYFSHNSPDGVSAGERVFSEARQLLGQPGENISLIKGVTHPLQEEALIREVHTGLMNSPRHRANIVSQEFNRGAVGVYLKGDSIYVTQVFDDAYAYLDDKAPNKITRGKDLDLSGHLVRPLDKTKTALMLVDVTDSRNKVQLAPKWLEEKDFKLQVTVLAKPGIYFLGLVTDNTFIPGPLIMVEK